MAVTAVGQDIAPPSCLTRRRYDVIQCLRALSNVFVAGQRLHVYLMSNATLTQWRISLRM